jgi:hypothetical protein
MRIPVKKINCLVLAAFASLPLGFAVAAPQPSAPVASPPAAPPSSLGSTSNATSAPATAPTDTATALDYFYNHPAEQGTAAKATSDLLNILGNKAEALDATHGAGSDDGLHDRFETYLSLQEVPEDRIKEYFGKMGEVTDALKAGNTFPAWKLLYAMSEYKDLDAGISRELANRVEAIWNSDKTQGGLEIATISRLITTTPTWWPRTCTSRISRKPPRWAAATRAAAATARGAAPAQIRRCSIRWPIRSRPRPR